MIPFSPINKVVPKWNPIFMNCVNHSTIFNRKKADRNYYQNFQYFFKKIKLIKSKFQSVDVKDAKNNKEFNDNNDSIQRLTLHDFMYFLLPNFPTKILL